jgi:hypothetical protein
MGKRRRKDNTMANNTEVFNITFDADYATYAYELRAFSTMPSTRPNFSHGITRRRKSNTGAPLSRVSTGHIRR